MTELPSYSLNIRVWMVGYHPEFDEMFVYFVDQDELCHVFRKGGLDSIGFCEFMNFSKAEILGEL